MISLHVREAKLHRYPFYVRGEGEGEEERVGWFVRVVSEIAQQ